MTTRFRRRAIAAAAALGLLLGIAWAWSAAGGRFANLWRTPAQQGDRLMTRRQFAEAARIYPDPRHRADALYRSGDFKQAAAEYGRVATPEGSFNRGNALVMAGQYPEAIASYDLAIRGRPGWNDPVRNREIARVRLQRIHPPNDGSEGTGGQIKPDEIAFDRKPADSKSQETETVTGGTMSDAEIQAVWLRRVQTKPADFLRAKFAYQQSRTSDSGNDRQGDRP
jgi:Ca-activated chloride channel family protein